MGKKDVGRGGDSRVKQKKRWFSLRKGTQDIPRERKL